MDRARGHAPPFQAAAARNKTKIKRAHTGKRFEAKNARRKHDGKRDVITVLTVFARGFGSPFVAQTGRSPLLKARNSKKGHHGSEQNQNWTIPRATALAVDRFGATSRDKRKRQNKDPSAGGAFVPRKGRERPAGARHRAPLKFAQASHGRPSFGKSGHGAQAPRTVVCPIKRGSRCYY